MVVKKQHESGSTGLSEAANDWFREFLKHLELYLVENGQCLSPDSKPRDYHLAAMQAVRLTLLDAGVKAEELHSLFSQIAVPKRQRIANTETDAKGYPAGYFEATEGSFAGEPLEGPPDLPPEEREPW